MTVSHPLGNITHDLRAREEPRSLSYATQELEVEKSKALDYLGEVKTRLVGERPSLPVRLGVRVGIPTPEIVGAARELGATLVVMATHGRTGLARLVLGSVADHVLREGTAPLVLVRPSRLREA